MPRVSDVSTEESEEGNLTFFNKRLSQISSKPRMEDSTCDLHPTAANLGRSNSFPPFSVLPTLLRDILGKADKWGNGGRIDPFSEVYDVSIFSGTTVSGINAECIVFSSFSS